MGLLKKALSEKNKKASIRVPGSVTDTMAVPTGFDLIDANTATTCITDNGEEFYSVGIMYGKITVFVGNSQGGKTTNAIQTAYNMAKEANGDIVVLDFERSSSNPRARFMQITGCSMEEFEEMFTIYNHLGMSTEFLKEIIYQIVDLKESLGKKCFIDHYDLKGNPVKIYPPTFIIVDSIPAMKPKEILDDSKLDNNMVFGKMAAANKALLTSIVEKLEQYNINIFGINHITTKIITNQYEPKKIQLPGLADNENLPGGNAWPYLASTVFKITSGAELKADKDMKIAGRVTEVRMLKTRSGFNNKRLKMIMHSKVGFSNALSNFYTAKEEKLLSGGGRGGFSFEGSPCSFTQGEFYPLYRTNPEFKEAFDNFMAAYYEQVMEAKNSDYGTTTEESGVDEEFDLDD